MKPCHPFTPICNLHLLQTTSLALLLTACGGGGGGAPPAPTPHAVDISWTANKETAVNSAGGGYKVAISGQPVIDVPYPYPASGPAATTTLLKGNYTVTVTAYSAIDPVTGMPASGVMSTSMASPPLAINVP